MNIKELNLIGFGKFENKSLKLEDGINIIYGENESGKTTVHSFIDGMFYGFLRPYLKTTRYTDEQDKYQPWSSKRYAGIIIFSHDGTLYRIEREFNKDNASTKVLLDNTGEDITHTIDTGERGRVLQPGFHFFGFNNVVYSNTVSIKQLCTKTDDKLSDELRDKLINVSTSLNEEISIDNALKELANKLKNIGSLKAPTSIYCKINDELINLTKEKEEILALKDNYDNLLDESERFNNELQLLEKKLDDERLLLRKVEYKEKKNTYTEAFKLNEELNKLRIELDNLEEYKDYNQVDYDTCVSIENDIKVIESKLEDTNNKIIELEESLSKSSVINLEKENKNIEDIKKDYLAFETFEEDKNKLLYGQDSSTVEFLKRDLDSTKAGKNKYIYGIIALAIIYIVFMFFTIVNQYTVLLPQLLIPVFILMVKKIKDVDTIVNRIEGQIKESTIADENRKKKISQIEEEQNIILKKYELGSKIEFRSLYENSQRENYKFQQELENKKGLKDRLNIENNKKNLLLHEKEDLHSKLNELLLKYDSSNILEIQSGLNNKRKYDELQIEFKNKKEIINKVLGEYTFERLEVELNSNKEYDSDEIGIEEISSKLSIKNRIDELIEIISQNKLDKKGIDEKINLINPKISKLVEIKEDIERCKEKLIEFDSKKEAIELAKSTIEELSKDIHNQFAPEINKKVGNIINKITNGKYSGVRIDNNLNIGVIDPKIGEIVNISNLSGGTIDQLYFSLRFGIINSMSGDNLPLILDDCFIQYDNNRLKNILNLLRDISKTRQVILFSCHNREMEILNDLNIDFNLITLS